MALVRKNRGLQYPLQAEFVFNLVDTMMATDGVTRILGAAGTANLFDVVALPPNAVVIGGDVTVDTASNDTTTATVTVGDAVNAARYLAATSIKTAGRTPLVPTGYRGVGEDIRLTFANGTGNASAGTVSVRVLYTITGRTNETQIA